MKPRLKHFLVKNDSGCWGEDPTGIDDTVVLRSTEQSANGDWRITDPAVRHISASERKTKTIDLDDIIITKSSGSADHIGKASIANQSIADLEAVYSNFMQRIRVNHHALPGYVWHLLNSSVARYHYNVYATSTSGLGNLNGSIIGNLPIPLPTLTTQRQIADFLDRETARIGILQVKTRTSIDRLREYRAALITGAVTGQIDVSDVSTSANANQDTNQCAHVLRVGTEPHHL
ncbi:MAG: restriction endonuclease subunit S [Rhodobacteraceae bacterium]|nr:restriction endonuclease subunit S [Paracoccaceae bacterium]